MEEINELQVQEDCNSEWYLLLPLPYLCPPTLSGDELLEKEAHTNRDECLSVRYLDLIDRRKTISLAIIVLQTIPRAPYTGEQASHLPN